MNFLAHAYLSGDNTKLLVGNFIGDFVKGRSYENFDKDIARGVKLHRSIDSYTDQHPVVRQSKRRLSVTYRHYSGVIVDIFYDHFLAIHWSNYHTEELERFTHHIYDTLEYHDNILPEKMKLVLKYMKQDNWLLQYATIKGIHQALTGMSRRARFKSNMEEAVEDLTKDYSLYEEEFKTFLPEIKDFATNWLSDH